MVFKQKAYHLLRRVTSQRQREHMKARISQVRRKISPALRRWYGTYGNRELESGLRRHIPEDFDILMVHSSISNMQPMYCGTARDLLDLLLRLVGPNRTLAMPTFFFGTSELFNRAYYRKYPRFDVRRTPSQMGLVTELFRRQAGIIRSMHPTHSVTALGPLAFELCGTHHLDRWPCGDLSPFAVMSRHKTAIIGLGVEYYRSLTQVHAIEERLGARFPIPRDEGAPPLHVQLTDQTGKCIDYEMSPPIAPGYVLKAERLAHFVREGDIKEWKLKGTIMYATEAAKIDVAIEQAALRGRTLYVPVTQ